MKVSLIVAVYKDIEALNLIIQALKLQTYKNFEVIVVEDNNSKEMKEYISKIDGLDVKHTFQEGDEIQKNTLNAKITCSLHRINLPDCL